jgi:cysteine desulfurase family protein (TIGR01976 family)
MARADVRTGQLDWDDLASLLGARTRLLAIGAASNALGAVTDVARATAMARAVGALTFVDAVHYAPHELVDVRALGCDFLACSAYKFYGPHVGIMWGRSELLAALDVPKLAPAPDTAPERLELGTQNHEGIAGAHAAVEALARWGGAGEAAPRRERLATTFGALHAEGRRLLARLWDGLGAVDGVVRYGPEPDRPRTPTVSFTVGALPARAVAVRLAERGVFVSHGDFYATTIVERLGLGGQGLVRAGCAAYTTTDEVDALLEGVREVARQAG